MRERQRDAGDSHPELFERAAGDRCVVPNDSPRVKLRPANTAPGYTPETAIEVSTLTRFIRDILEGAFPPGGLWIRGEIIGFKRYSKGNWYFTLRGDNAVIKCVMWAQDAQRMKVPPVDGLSVLALCFVRMYAKAGEVQISVKALQAVGDGMLRMAFEQTRQRLEADGLFAPARKRALPAFPRCIAIVTSQDGAALHDIVTVALKRCPIVQLVVIPAIVQGDEAPKSLRRALTRLTKWRGADLVIIGRGGGSREDLWAFNDEQLARAVAACPVPTISAVGHQVDTTICDLVADHCAPTPSAAAEMAVPELQELRERVADCALVLGRQVARLTALGHERLGVLTQRLQARAEQVVERRRLRLESYAGRLDALSPLATLGRGYAAVFTGEGAAISDAGAVNVGDDLRVRMRDGSFGARVESKDASGGALR
ncbi:MAG: exodeoxyribonuclease VII large subunit [Gemmatimonadaceae bacterium]